MERTLEQLRERAQKIALGQYLSEYPKEKTFDEVLEAIKTNDGSVLVWEPFENDSVEHIAEMIVYFADFQEYELKWAAGIVIES